MPGPVLVIGAGWAGATVARRLTDAGVPVEVLERAAVTGGHARAETLGGVVYEPNGPHILHTNDPAVARFFGELELTGRPYHFQPLTEIELADGTPRLLSWPIQISQVEELPDWPTIERQLAALPAVPAGDDFETFVVSMMGRRLYELFIEGYTRKQWGCEPATLSSSFAPKRVDLRRDGNLDLFSDRWQFFPADDVNAAIDTLLQPVTVTCGADVTAMDLRSSDAAAIVVTAALDDFMSRRHVLDWRGVHLRSFYQPTDLDSTVTAAHVINRPSMNVPYTRTIETKHATGQRIGGTVVSEEYPGAPARHYPVATIDGRNERANDALQRELRWMLAPVPVYFCGRLATYRYINQDEAVLSAWACADEVLANLHNEEQTA